MQSYPLSGVRCSLLTLTVTGHRSPLAVGIPSIAEDRFTTETSATNTWTWGKTTEYNTQYTATFSVVVAPHTSVRVSCVVNQGALNVPFTMHLSGEGSGAKLETAGTLRGVSSWDLRHVVTTLDPKF